MCVSDLERFYRSPCVKDNNWILKHNYFLIQDNNGTTTFAPTTTPDYTTTTPVYTTWGFEDDNVAYMAGSKVMI